MYGSVRAASDTVSTVVVSTIETVQVSPWGMLRAGASFGSMSDMIAPGNSEMPQRYQQTILYLYMDDFRLVGA